MKRRFILFLVGAMLLSCDRLGVPVQVYGDLDANGSVVYVDGQRRGVMEHDPDDPPDAPRLLVSYTYRVGGRTLALSAKRHVMVVVTPHGDTLTAAITPRDYNAVYVDTKEKVLDVMAIDD